MRVITSKHDGKNITLKKKTEKTKSGGGVRGKTIIEDEKFNLFSSRRLSLVYLRLGLISYCLHQGKSCETD